MSTVEITRDNAYGFCVRKLYGVKFSSCGMVDVDNLSIVDFNASPLCWAIFH